MIYKMQLADSVDSMEFDLLEVPIQDKDIEGAVDNTLINGNVFTDYLWLKKKFSQKWSIMCPDEYDRLRGFYTRQWQNAEVPKYKLFIGANISEIDTASGEYINITNTTDYSAPITDLELYGNATQNGTPTPDSPVAVQTTTGENVVKIEGKNLSDLVPVADATLTGLAYATSEIVNDAILGRRVLHMTATGAYPTAKYTLPERLESGKYYALTLRYKTAYEGTGSTTRQDMWIAPNWSSNVWDVGSCFANGRAKSQTGVIGARIPQSANWTTATWRFYVDPEQYSSVSQSYTFIAFSLGYGLESTTTSKEAWFADIMLTEITQAEWDATNYTDYDFKPHHMRKYEVNLGKNLLDPSWMVAGYMTSTGGTITYSQTQGEMACEEYIPVEPNTEYTFEIFETTDTYPEWFGISQYSTADTSGFISRTVKTGASPQTWFYTFTTTATTHYIRPSARNLQHATKYMLSKGGRTTYAPYFTPIELAKIGTYQDYIWKDGDEWKAHKATAKIESYAGEGITTDYLSTTGSLTTGATIYYGLTTPTDTQITEQALINQLNAITSASLFTGVNNITLTGTGAQGSLKIDFELIYSKEEIIIPQTAVRLTLTDGGVINPCGCRQNVQLEMRETVQ